MLVTSFGWYVTVYAGRGKGGADRFVFVRAFCKTAAAFLMTPCCAASDEYAIVKGKTDTGFKILGIPFYLQNIDGLISLLLTLRGVHFVLLAENRHNLIITHPFLELIIDVYKRQSLTSITGSVN